MKEFTMRSLLTGYLVFFSATMVLLADSYHRAFAGEYRPVHDIISELVPSGNDDNQKLAIDLDIRFESNSAELTPEALRQLDALGVALKSEKLATSRFQINGHTDAVGTKEYNKSLSLKRALMAKDFLVRIHSIEAANLDAVGWGEERLKYPFSPKNEKNRRVEIVNMVPILNSLEPPVNSMTKGNKNKGSTNNGFSVVK